MKRIGLYCSNLNNPYLVGCNRYAQSLTKEQIPLLDGNYEMLLYGPQDLQKSLQKDFEPPLHSLSPNLSFDEVSRGKNIALWHMLTDAPAPFEKTNTPYVVTCHGLTIFHLMTQTKTGMIPGSFWDYLDYPDSIFKAFKARTPLAFSKKLIYQRKAQKVHHANIEKWKIHLLGARKVIAVSQFVKDEITQDLKIPDDKVCLIHEAADESFGDASFKSKETLEKYQLPEEYVLCVTNLQHVKNIDGLFQLAKHLKENHPRARLVYAYLNNPYEERYFRKLKEFGLEPQKDIFFLKNIPQDELKSVLQQAKLCINLAWIETFGLPIVEAMKAGVPIISSDRCALKEVVDDGGLSLDPNDLEQFCTTVTLALDNDILLQDLRRKSLARGKEFSWRKAAIETLKVYEDVLQTDLTESQSL